jgi:hypothetical protein
MQMARRTYSISLKMKATSSSETWVDFNGLHGVISQKIELFITTAVRTSDATIFFFRFLVMFFR